MVYNLRMCGILKTFLRFHHQVKFNKFICHFFFIYKEKILRHISFFYKKQIIHFYLDSPFSFWLKKQHYDARDIRKCNANCLILLYYQIFFGSLYFILRKYLVIDKINWFYFLPAVRFHKRLFFTSRLVIEMCVLYLSCE